MENKSFKENFEKAFNLEDNALNLDDLDGVAGGMSPTDEQLNKLYISFIKHSGGTLEETLNAIRETFPPSKADELIAWIIANWDSV